MPFQLKSDLLHNFWTKLWNTKAKKPEIRTKVDFSFERANILSKKPARKIGRKIRKKPTFEDKPWPKLVKNSHFLGQRWDRRSPYHLSTLKKAFHNVWHNGLRLNIFQLDLPTKMTRWLSDFLVGRLIQVNVNNFFYSQINPKAGVPQGSVLSPLLFLIYVNDLPTPHHKQNSLSQFADGTAQWAFSRNVRIAAKLLQQDLLKLAMWCAKWRSKLNPVKTKVIIFSRSILTRKTELNLKLYGETLKIYPQVKFLGITFDSQLTF